MALPLALPALLLPASIISMSLRATLEETKNATSDRGRIFMHVCPLYGAVNTSHTGTFGSCVKNGCGPSTNTRFPPLFGQNGAEL